MSPLGDIIAWVLDWCIGIVLLLLAGMLLVCLAVPMRAFAGWVLG